MALNLNPHEYTVNPETSQPTLLRINPYVRLRQDDGPPLFLQGGQVYSEGGPLIPREEWPDWLVDAILRLNNSGLEESGFKDFVQDLNKPSAPPNKPAAPPAKK